MLNEVNHYEILGVPENADIATIKAATREMRRRYHPDMRNAGASNDDIVAINLAWAVLGDPEKRARYNARLRQGRLAKIQIEHVRMWNERHGTKPGLPSERTVFQRLWGAGRFSEVGRMGPGALAGVMAISLAIGTFHLLPGNRPASAPLAAVTGRPKLSRPPVMAADIGAIPHNRLPTEATGGGESVSIVAQPMIESSRHFRTRDAGEPLDRRRLATIVPAPQLPMTTRPDSSVAENRLVRTAEDTRPGQVWLNHVLGGQQ